MASQSHGDRDLQGQLKEPSQEMWSVCEIVQLKKPLSLSLMVSDPWDLHGGKSLTSMYKLKCSRVAG